MTLSWKALLPPRNLILRTLPGAHLLEILRARAEGSSGSADETADAAVGREPDEPSAFRGCS